MATPNPEYDRTLYRDRLFPEGRPQCRLLDGQPVYLQGLCGEHFAEQPIAEALAEYRQWRGGWLAMPVQYRLAKAIRARAAWQAASRAARRLSR